MSRIVRKALLCGISLTATLLATRSAEALVPPQVAACYLPNDQGCLPLNPYECDDRHGRWDNRSQCVPPTTDPAQQGTGQRQP